jgi:hypothetical protein
MIFDWTEILPAVLLDLTPFHQEIASYLMNQPGKRRPAFTHAKLT